MEKIRNSSTYGGLTTGQTGIDKTDSVDTSSSSTTAPAKESSAQDGKCVEQEARTREKESGLQASIRKHDLLAQAQKGGVKNEAAQCVGKPAVNKTLKSEAEVRELVQKRLFPAVKEGMEKSGLSVNDLTCNYATGMMKNALEMQGVGGVTIKGVDKHAYLEVKTADGKTLIVDPTASQWTKDGSAIDEKLQKEGFIGTRDDLRKMIGQNLDNWNLVRTPNLKIDDQVLEAARGKSVPKITQQEAQIAIQPLVDIAIDQAYVPEKGKEMYPGLSSKFEGQIPAEAARQQAEWYEKGNLDEPLHLRAWQIGMDRAPQLKQAYQAMEEALRKSQEE